MCICSNFLRFFRITREFRFILRYFRNLKFNGFFIFTRIFFVFLSYFVRNFYAHQNAPFCIVVRGTCSTSISTLQTRLLLSTVIRLIFANTIKLEYSIVPITLLYSITSVWHTPSWYVQQYNGLHGVNAISH